MKFRTATLLAATAALCACDAAEDVRIQELPALDRSSLEARLGLPQVAGPWRFAGWELAQGDTLGLDAELPGFGILWLQTQKRDSVAGFYLTSGGGRAPLQGEVRRNGVLSLVAFPQPEDGRYLVGEVIEDTLWLETTTLVEPGSWRGDARAAFVRSQQAVSPFRRVRGAMPAPVPQDSAALAAATDSLSTGTVAQQPATMGTGRDAAEQPSATQPRQPPTPPVTTTPRAETPVPTTEPVPTEPAAVEPEAEPEPEPEPVREREPPRVLGEPVVRD